MDPKYELKLVPWKVEKHFVVLFLLLELKLGYSQVISVWPQFFSRLFVFFGFELCPPRVLDFDLSRPHVAKRFDGVPVLNLDLE